MAVKCRRHRSGCFVPLLSGAASTVYGEESRKHDGGVSSTHVRSFNHIMQWIDAFDATNCHLVVIWFLVISVANRKLILSVTISTITTITIIDQNTDNNLSQN